MVDADLTAPTTGSAGDPPRIAFLSYGTGQYDARTFRMARSSLAAGYRVTVYARWQRGLPAIEEREGYRVVRAPSDWRLTVPGLRRLIRRRLHAAMDAAGDVAGLSAAGSSPPSSGPLIADPSASGPSAALPGRAARRLAWLPLTWWRRLKLFPLMPMGWASALAEVAEPADIWHGMWAGSLPALTAMRRRHGGRTIYDSRDLFLESRGFAQARGPLKDVLVALERRWARQADRIITVNGPYADFIASRWRVRRPSIVMNCPERWDPPAGLDLIREALGLSADRRIALYQGGLMTDRGIEASMDAILEVSDASLCLLGFGPLAEALARRAAAPPYAGRVHLLPAVPPEALLRWTASADVCVMAIPKSSINHRYSTPQKLFESLAAGVPVVASDLPAMAAVVREIDAGALCDPTSPTSIAAAIRAVLDEPPELRASRRVRILAAANERYSWEAQVGTLMGIYRELAPVAGVAR